MMNYNGELPKGPQTLANGIHSSIQTASVGDQAMLTYVAPQQSEQQQQESISQQRQQQQQIAGVNGLSSANDDDDIIRFSADLEQLLDYASSNSGGGSARVSPKYYGNNGESDDPLPAVVKYSSSKVSTGAHTSTSTYTNISTQPLHIRNNNPNSGTNTKFLQTSSTQSQLHPPAATTTMINPTQTAAASVPNQMIYKYQQPQVQPQVQPQSTVTQPWLAMAPNPQGPIPASSNMTSSALLPTAFPAQTYAAVGSQPQQQPPFSAAPMSVMTAPQARSPVPVLSNITAKRSRRKSGKRRREANDLQTTEEPDLPSSVSEDESDKHRRRLERNMREQERSHRITGQIAELRDLLNQAKVSFKPDKYSTLASVSDYIQSLQKKSIWLEDEHRKLLQTISKTNDIVNNAEMHGFDSHTSVVKGDRNGPQDQQPQVVPSGTNKSQFGNVFEDEFVSFCRGLDYKGVFFHCGTPICVTGVDGRILDCNEKFLSMFMMTREDLQSRSQDKSRKQLSIFNLIENNDMRIVFASMSNMLKNTDFLADPANQQVKSESGKISQGSLVVQSHRFLKSDHWSGFTKQSIGPQKTVSCTQMPHFTCLFSCIQLLLMSFFFAYSAV